MSRRVFTRRSIAVSQESTEPLIVPQAAMDPKIELDDFMTTEHAGNGATMVAVGSDPPSGERGTHLPSDPMNDAMRGDSFLPSFFYPTLNEPPFSTTLRRTCHLESL